MSDGTNSRRKFLAWTAAGGSFLVLGPGRIPRLLAGEPPVHSTRGDATSKSAPPANEEVTATEDLMREHGVLRRALLVYAECAVRLRQASGSVPPGALRQTATLFRAFGEEYHEKKLEEAYIFPAVVRAGGPAAAYPPILLTQHQRGRELTEYILSATRGAKLGAVAAPLAAVLETFARMYQHHAAREDTIVFPAWKAAVTAAEYDELSDKFEAIEQQQFGADGFEAAVRQIGAIETQLGLADIAQFTAPPPPSH